MIFLSLGPGLPAAVAVTPILVHRTPPVHDPDNMDDEEMQATLVLARGVRKFQKQHEAA